jgi:hypothetical protein
MGAPLAELGDPFAACDLVALEGPPAAQATGSGLQVVVSRVDRFGNLALAASAADAAAANLRPGSAVRVQGPSAAAEAVFARAFADVPEGALLVHIDSSGALALAVNRGSAAERLGAGAGAQMELAVA